MGTMPENTKLPTPSGYASPALIGLMLGGLTVALPWFSICDAIGFAFLAAIALPVVEAIFLRRAFSPGRLRRARWVAGILMVGLPIIVVSAGAGNRAFVAAFGVAPVNVKDLSISSQYAGGPGDLRVRMEFTMDEVTLQKLVAARGMKRTIESGRVIVAPFSNRPSGACEKYDWSSDGGSGEGPHQSLQLFWYPASGRALAVHLIG